MEYIKELLKLNSEYNNKLYAVKTALVKYMTDKGIYFDVLKHIDEIFDNFTFNNILSLWAERDIHIIDEEEQFLSVDARIDIYTLVTDADINLKNEPPSYIGRVYEESLCIDEKKKTGVTYTPEDLCEYMISLIRNDVKKTDIFIDPACGCGIFLEGFYDALMYASCEDTSGEKIYAAHKRILHDAIYGCDTSEESCAISKTVLALKCPLCVIPKHIYCCDSLLNISEYVGESEFDWVVTNPPYVGHKQMDPRYRKRIEQIYRDVYYDKADLSYCFFMLGQRLLKENGRLLYITSRYFAQSKFAQGLREFILNEFSFVKAVDFYGVRPFKNAGVDPMIIYLTKTKKTAESFYAVKYSAEADFNMLAFKENEFTVFTKDLSKDGFNFLTAEQMRFFNAVQKRCVHTLKELVDFFQGIITGCDKAFVVSSDSLIYSACIDECGKKWLKSKDLKEKIDFKGQYVLYTNSLSDITDAPYTLKRLELFKTRLEKRRECASGVRKWYELQWGRNSELFEEPKVIFAYKGTENNFIYDDSSYYFSADIYGFAPKENIRDILNIQNLIMLLNTPIYDVYFKSFAKKLGGRLYEYYPNTVCKIKIPPIETINGFTCEEDINAYFGINDADLQSL